ncbi:MAG: hypothetical protein JW928_02290, partial [Candidatus Aureabacteria bacterium]|nr:hypothetical protein [Candidatus Auribacterota bacterium]
GLFLIFGIFYLSPVFCSLFSDFCHLSIESRKSRFEKARDFLPDVCRHAGAAGFHTDILIRTVGQPL